MTDTQAGSRRAAPDRVRKLLKRYQILSYLTCVGLMVLVFVGVPLNWFFDQGIVSAIVGPVHGLIYIVYLACVFDLANRCKWQPVRTLLVMGAGLIPFATLYAERVVVRHVNAETLA